MLGGGYSCAVWQGRHGSHGKEVRARPPALQGTEVVLHIAATLGLLFLPGNWFSGLATVWLGCGSGVDPCLDVAS